MLQSVPFAVAMCQPDVTLSGMKIPANTLFYGVATLGANRLDVVVSNLKVGDNLNPEQVQMNSTHSRNAKSEM